MADGQFSGHLGQFFHMGINIRPVEQGEGGG